MRSIRFSSWSIHSTERVRDLTGSLRTHPVDLLADSGARSLDGQLQRLRQSSLKLLTILSRDDLFRHLLTQSDSTRARTIIASSYWRVCAHVLAIATRLVHQSKFECSIRSFDVLRSSRWTWVERTPSRNLETRRMDDIEQHGSVSSREIRRLQFLSDACRSSVNTEEQTRFVNSSDQVNREDLSIRTTLLFTL